MLSMRWPDARDVQGHREAERHRHRMLAVRAAHLRRAGVAAGQCDELAFRARSDPATSTLRVTSRRGTGARAVSMMSAEVANRWTYGWRLGADLLADAVDQGADVVLDAAFFLVDLLRLHIVGGAGDLRRRSRRADAEVGQRLRQGRLDAGQIADLGVLGDVGDAACSKKSASAK